MKSVLYTSSGAKKSDISLPAVFETPLREDVIAKCVEAEKFSEMHHYESYDEAGKRHSASGKISHRRHKWQGHYGKGIARLPRKKMWRRGTQFYWVGAEVANTRGGRRAHPPQHMKSFRKINAKERMLAIKIGIAATASPQHHSLRYSSFNDKNLTAPVIESLPNKMKSFREAISNIMGSSSMLVLKNKEVRAGKGKLRGRKYKSSAGLLVIKSKDEMVSFKGVDVRSVDEIMVGDLYPLGRLALYTQKALEELKNVA